MTSEDESESIIESFSDIADKFGYCIDKLFQLITNGYNPYLYDFDKNDDCYVISTCENIIKCKVLKRLEKDEDEKFSYAVFPHPIWYRPGLITRIKYIIETNFGYKFRYSFPWETVPNRTIAGLNMFKSYVEAYHFLQLAKIYNDLNILLRYSFKVQQQRNPEKLEDKNLVDWLEEYKKEKGEINESE